MRKISCLIIVLSVFLFNACDSPKAESKFNLASDMDFFAAVKEAGEIMREASYEGDYETLLGYFAEDAVLAPDLHPVLKGKAEIRKGYMKQKKEGVKVLAFNSVPEKMWEDSINIYEYGSYTTTYGLKKKNNPYAVSGSYFLIWEKRENDKVQIKYLMSNLNFNPYEDI